MDHARPVPEDLNELEILLMQGASTIRQVEAAERLVLKVDNLREWLIKNNYLRMHMSETGPYAATYFAEAFAAVVEILRGGSIALEASGLTKSSFSALAVAANLSGRVQNSIRYTVHEIDDVDAQAVAEAILYAMGYMDATVDLYGNEVDGDGPNRLAYEKRWVEP
ncbi:hypothetical protein [Streptacidiphilus sp. P02-A3a]|uniref:hypothetical protein n=1 Tax=Streptacidiphilus sp. P02-A3a TaxID=2704468 RepID=UPI0015FBAC5A|nr:hypothetical protein [Streptacidiphilus sp. P02-A3a]QMU73119.1 hypothetical protein GXP74_37655 [Streptacidiphilus sp. P02-A3a]